MGIISFWFFKEIELNSEYQKIEINTNNNLTRSIEITLVSDSSSDISFSWDGIELAGILKSKEILEIDKIKRNKIYVKGSGSMRVWAHEFRPKE